MSESFEQAMQEIEKKMQKEMKRSSRMHGKHTSYK